MKGSTNIIAIKVEDLAFAGSLKLDVNGIFATFTWTAGQYATVAALATAFLAAHDGSELGAAFVGASVVSDIMCVTLVNDVPIATVVTLTVDTVAKPLQVTAFSLLGSGFLRKSIAVLAVGSFGRTHTIERQKINVTI